MTNKKQFDVLEQRLSNKKVLNIKSWEFDCSNDKLKFRITISKIINTLQDTF